ncbi:MAG TPA: DUF3048 domain-containing protein [Actinomycetota bacterium]|nr:DUF3048 domain-containing protein [Actinomycetota bacterium]
MAFTRGGRVVAGIATVVVVVAAAVGVLALTGNADKIPVINQLIAPPEVCPLTGETPKSGNVPDRPALAIKVENLPEARPQAGIESADVVYEEPVEGGITRFIVVFQCHDSKRVGPVRSARFTDVDILPQYGTQTLFGYAGGAPPVEQRVEQSGLNDVNFQQPKAESAYIRDPKRIEPHNLYTSTGGLYRAGGTSGGKPTEVLQFSSKPPASASPAHRVEVDFSPTADVFWTYAKKRGAWVRSYDTGPADLENGSSITARNVVVQIVKVHDTQVVDANGVASPEVVATGTGLCLVFRGGNMIRGTWSRPTPGDLTTYRDADGRTIGLAPGSTWIELYPNTAAAPVIEK